MQKLTAYVSGKVQESGYRSRAVTIAKALGIKGFVKNLEDGRVLIVAEGERSDLERFAKALFIKNSLINVTDIKEEYTDPTGIFDGFDKIVGDNETDSRLDTAANYLKVLITLTEKGLGKQDQMLGKQDEMLGKMDQMLDKQDQMLDKQDELAETAVESKEEIVKEIRDLRFDLKVTLDERLLRIESDVAQIKAKIGL